MLNKAHEGYEYQDFFTTAIAMDLMLRHPECELEVDSKDFKRDKFDDLKVLYSSDTKSSDLQSGSDDPTSDSASKEFCNPDATINDKYSIVFQIKYSDENTGHALEKVDFSNGNGHDTCLTDLYTSWHELRKRGDYSSLLLCLAWKRPAAVDDLNKFLEDITESIDSNAFSLPFECVVYRFKANEFWPEDNNIPSDWRKVKKYLLENQVDRNDFIEFCNDLKIVVELPKASLDFSHPLQLETDILSLVNRLGVGIYPNENITNTDFVNKLAMLVKRTRAKGGSIAVDSLAERLGLITDYGRLDQNFPVDKNVQVSLTDEVRRLDKEIKKSNRLILTGNPGSGKSWFIEEFTQHLRESKSVVVRYSCFLSLDDVTSIERIKTNSLYGNFVSQLIEQIPQLKSKKDTLLGADKSEVEKLLNEVKGTFYVIIDGLDHIEREYNLNKETISQGQTTIIKELTQIVFPENCHVLIVSQPVEDLDLFKEKGYREIHIKGWDIRGAKTLMSRYGLADITLENENYVSDSPLFLSRILLEKSQGNVLYLGYLIRQLQECQKNPRYTVSVKSLHEIPDYDISLSNYYSYISGKISNTKIVFALTGADFYLSASELSEITGMGDYVLSDLEILKPVVRESAISGGVIIYHESFRRFILNSLKTKQVDVNKNVYGDLIAWLHSKPFYLFEKSYYYLPALYLKTGSNDIVKLIRTDFVTESIREGYSRDAIRSSIVYFIQGAARAHDIVALATSSELLAMLDDLNDANETNTKYLQALSATKGANKLNNLLQNNGRPTFFDVAAGLDACYICSRNGVRPWWELYLNVNAKTFKVDQAKYYFRYCVDTQGTESIPRIMKGIEKDKEGIRSELVEELYPEIISYIGEDEALRICGDSDLTFWNKYINEQRVGFADEQSVSIDDAVSLFDAILKIEYPSDENIGAFYEFFNIEFSLVRQDLKTVSFFDDLISKCEGINWFHNWIIYMIRIVRLWAKRAESGNEFQINQDNEILDALHYLIKDTEVFKGKPRTCDLYSLRGIMNKSYYMALRMISSIDNLNNAIGILKDMADRTATVFDHSSSGPLTNENFIIVLSQIINDGNKDVVIPYIESCAVDSANCEAYEYAAEANFELAVVLAKYDIERARHYYDLGISYLVGYGYHKDIIIEQVLDPYSEYYSAIERSNQGKQIAIKKRDAITAMTRALFTHTDGRSTNHYLNLWTEKLLQIDSLYALSFINGFQIFNEGGGIADDMILSIVCKYCSSPKFTRVVISLIESLPNNMGSRLIDAASCILKRLISDYTDNGTYSPEDGEQLVRELTVNILSRFNILDEKQKILDHSPNQEAIIEFINLAEHTGLDIQQYRTYFSSGEDITNKGTTVSSGESTYEKNEEFRCNSYDEAIEWFEKNDITDENSQDVIAFLQSLEKTESSDEKIYSCFKSIIFRNWWDSSSKFENRILVILDKLNYSDELSIKVHTLMFVNSYEWGSSLTNGAEFEEAYRRNANIAFEVLFNELPSVAIRRSGRISAGLISALSKVGYDENTIIAIWENVFDIIKQRFPNLYRYNQRIELNVASEYYGVIDALVGRIIDGGKEQFLTAYSYIADCGKSKQYSEVEEAFLFSLSNFNKWNYVTQLGIVTLIGKYGCELNDKDQHVLIKAIDKIYPTGNLLLDVLFSSKSIYYSSIGFDNKKYEPDIYNRDELKYYLEENLPDLGDLEASSYSEEDNSFVEGSIYRDPILVILSNIGVDYQSFYKMIHSSSIVQHEIRYFVSGTTDQPEMNTVYKSYVLHYALHELLKKAYESDDSEVITKHLLCFIPDFDGMYLYRKCRVLPPENHLFLNDDSSVFREFVVNSADEYTRVGCAEVKKVVEYRKNAITLAYEGLVTADWNKTSEKQKIPFEESFVLSFFHLPSYQMHYDDSCLIDLQQKWDKEFEGEAYLWPAKVLCEKFHLRRTIGQNPYEFYAVNDQDEVVFVMRNWRACYNGNSDYRGNAIPLYFGVELLVKTNFLRILVAEYGELFIANKLITVV